MTSAREERPEGPVLATSTDDDAGWQVHLGRPGAAERQRVDESLGCLADGLIGTRASLEEDGPDARELVLANGILTPEPEPRVLPGPIWTRVPLASDDPRRTLDLRHGTLLRDGADVAGVRFSSLARPGLVGLRVTGRLLPAPHGPLTAPEAPEVTVASGEDGEDHWMVTSAGGVGLVAVATETRAGSGDRQTLERLAVYEPVDHDPVEARSRAARRLADARTLGFDALLTEHRSAWEARWRDVDVEIVGDPVSQRGIRFALFHLLASVPERGEAAVTARGLSGTAYDGHVFWDADVFVLPAVTALRPAAARAMLAYRLARLPVARTAATDQGHAGARFPWESGTSGRDVTPRTGTDLEGNEVPILTGEHALHITADVAWAALHHVAWTGETLLTHGPGRDLILDTARYWASRIEVDADGTGHLRQVVGPDEYHGPVDDDLYTNVLARWNLRAAADHAAQHGGADAAERARWQQLADRLVVPYDPVTGRHEQFAGYDRLEPLLISELVDLPVAADVLLGPERTSAAQVLKQPDVVMAHHLLPDDLPPGSLVADLDHEGPRTAHGSSLSLPIHACALARAGRPDEALEAFRQAARLDLDDLTGTTAAGLHLATMGGLVQAVIWGFAGLRPHADGLRFAPQLPRVWERLRFQVRYRGAAIHLDLTPERSVAEADRPVVWSLSQGPPRTARRVVVTGDGRVE